MAQFEKPSPAVIYF